MKSLTTFGTMITVAVGTTILVGLVYAAGDHFGFRPAVIKEVRDLRNEQEKKLADQSIMIAANTDRSLILQIDNYDRSRRFRDLTRDECRSRNRAAKALGEPQGCLKKPPQVRQRRSPGPTSETVMFLPWRGSLACVGS